MRPCNTTKSTGSLCLRAHVYIDSIDEIITNYPKTIVKKFLRSDDFKSELQSILNMGSKVYGNITYDFHVRISKLNHSIHNDHIKMKILYEVSHTKVNANGRSEMYMCPNKKALKDHIVWSLNETYYRRNVPTKSINGKYFLLLKQIQNTYPNSKHVRSVTPNGRVK